MGRRLWMTLALALCLAVPAAAAWADDDYDAADLSESGFDDAGEADNDEVPGGVFLLAAYCALFALVGGYTVHLSRRQARVQKEFGELRRAVEDIDDQLGADVS